MPALPAPESLEPLNLPTDGQSALVEATDEPNLDELIVELKALAEPAGEVRTRRQTAHDVRYCRWEGQSDDLRKHQEEMDEEAMPWEGAADTRIHLADEIINDRVAAYVLGLFRAEVQATAIESGDIVHAQRMSTLLRWLRNVRLAGELRREATLAANYMEGGDPGLAIIGVYWKQDIALKLKETKLDEVLAQIAEQLPPEQAAAASEGLQALLYDPAREGEAIALLRQQYPTAQERALRRALQELRETQRTKLPAPYVRENRPCVSAHRLYDDLFVSADTDDLQRARAIYRREWLTEVELRERVATYGWDRDWVAAMIQKCRGLRALPEAVGETVDETLGGIRVDETEPNAKNFEVWYAYARQADEYGVPGIWLTVFHPAVADAWASHALLDYWHGQYPFVDLRREILDRGLTATRGVTVVAATHQYETKVQRDARTNHAQLATNPPAYSRVRAGGVQLAIRPGLNVPVRDPSDVGFMAPPPGPASSIEIEAAVRHDANSYFGRAAEGLDPTRVVTLQQAGLDQWLAGWVLVFRQVLALCLQYMSPEEVARVTGGQPQPVQGPEELQGSYDIALKIDVRDLNLEYAAAKMALVGQALGLDTMGVTDRSKLAKLAMAMIDPNMAEQVISSNEQATLREIDDEQTNVTKMANGIEVPAQESGQNYGLRLQVLDGTIQRSPKLQQQYQADALFTQLVDARRKHFQQMLTQQQNAQIGRTGYVPVLGGGAA